MYINKNTKTNKMLLLVALMTSLFSLLFAAASCSDDLVDTDVVSGEDDVPGGVYIITRVADSSYGTRSSSSISTTASWQGGDFDEVGITSLSVLFFKPVSSTDTVLAYAFTTTLPEDTTKRDYVTTSTGETGIRWLVPNWPTSSSTSTSMSSFTLTDATTFEQSVTPTPIDSVPATYTIYAIANHDWGDNDLTIGTTTPAALRKLLTNDDDSTKMAQQPATARTYGMFEMSDYIVSGSSSCKDDTDEYGVAYRRDYELTLKRAVGKMCLRVYYTASDASSPTLLTEAGSESSTDDNDFHNTEHEISFRLVRYAACAPLTADGTDLTTVYSKSGSSTTKHSLYTQTEFTDPTSDNGMLYATTDDACVVFYSYPNNWADSSAIEAGTINLNTTVPIVEDRQTYVQMQIKHTPSSLRSVTYTYDIPTNYLLPEYNDAVSLTDDQKEELYAAYRIDRNTAYWMTLYVEEVEAGLRVACSTGSGASASIADLEDDPNVVVLSATSTTTVTINDFDDGTGDDQKYDTASGDSVFTEGYTWTDFSETVYLSDITSVAFTLTSEESDTGTSGNGNNQSSGESETAEGGEEGSTDGDSSSSSSVQSATFSAEMSGYPCTGTLMLTSYTDNSNWKAVSSTSYTADSSTDGAGNTGESTSTTADDDTTSDDTTSGTATYTATVSSIVCASTYTCSSGTKTLSSTITVTYSISGGTTDGGSNIDDVSVTYTGSSLSSWTESSDTTSGEGTEE